MYLVFCMFLGKKKGGIIVSSIYFLHNALNFLLQNPSPNHAIGAEHGPIFPPICHQLLLSQSTTFGTNTLIHLAQVLLHTWHKYCHILDTSTVTYLTQVLCHTFSTPGQSKPHNTHFPLFVTNSFRQTMISLFHWLMIKILVRVCMKV